MQEYLILGLSGLFLFLVVAGIDFLFIGDSSSPVSSDKKDFSDQENDDDNEPRTTSRGW